MFLSVSSSAGAPLQGTLSPLCVHPMFKPTPLRSVSQERRIVRPPLPSLQATKTRGSHNLPPRPKEPSTTRHQTKRENVSGRIATIDRRVAPSRGAGSTGEPRHATRPGRRRRRVGNTRVIIRILACNWTTHVVAGRCGTSTRRQKSRIWQPHSLATRVASLPRDTCLHYTRPGWLAGRPRAPSSIHTPPIPRFR